MMSFRRKAQEGGDACIPMLNHVGVWQKPRQYGRAIILQLKIKKPLKNDEFQNRARF